jgi:hypothetical protein
MTPDRERKAAERARRKEAGLVRVEVWVPREMAETAKSLMLAIIKENADPYRKAAVSCILASVPNYTMLKLMDDVRADIRRVTGIDEAMLGQNPKGQST